MRPSLPARRVAADGPSTPAATLEQTVVDGHALSVKIPAVAASGKPWLWVAEYPGHLQSLEDGLVLRGWHVAHVKVSGQFGSARAMAIWEKVYAELCGRRGLSARPALLGISRGGLEVCAWVRRHPGWASVLYLDNGLCDARSWPGGFPLKSKAEGSAKDWERYKAEFEFATDEEACSRSLRPAEGLDQAVKAGVLLISVHGTADAIVPYLDNAEPVVQFWEQARGRLRVFAKPGGNHHPHGLPDPAPLIELLCTEAQ